ncbi:MAG: hypothetical protein AAFR12_23505, partial [Cyanobacteria bacterium J06626_6]
MAHGSAVGMQWFQQMCRESVISQKNMFFYVTLAYISRFIPFQRATCNIDHNSAQSLACSDAHLADNSLFFKKKFLL